MKNKFKALGRFLISKMFLINVLLAILVMVGIFYLVMSRHRSYTRQDEKIVVDSYYGMQYADAVKQIEAKGLVAEIDSVFRIGAEPGTVLLQDPASTDSSKQYVKSERVVILKVQAIVPPGREIPNVYGFSRRIVETKLLSRGLRPKVKLVDAPDTYVQQKYVLVNGKEVMPGEKVAIGAEVTFFVGRGKAKPVEVPVLEGLTISEATRRLSSASLIFDYAGCETCQAAEDSMTAIVIRQFPKGGKGVYSASGSEVTLWFGTEAGISDDNE